jgi:NitT/TauT family transport system substrate-binding protein
MKRFQLSERQSNMSRKSVLSGIAAAAALTLTLSGCGQPQPTAPDQPTSDQPASPSKISIAMQPWLGYGAWYIAQDEGIFTENGLEVSLPDFDADADMVAALAAGQVDAMNVASHTALRMIEEGIDLKVVLLLDASTSADAIISTGEVKTVAELRGKQVAYEEGATSDLLLNYALAENGMTIADVQKVPMLASEAGAALIANRVPVAVTYEPYITAAKSGNSNVTTIYQAGAKPGLISDVLAVRADLLTSNPQAVAALAKSWGEAVDYYNANNADGRAIISKGVGEDPADLATAFDGVQYFDLAENKAQLTGEFLNSTYPAIQEAAIAAGLLKGTATPAAAIDTTPLG